MKRISITFAVLLFVVAGGGGVVSASAESNSTAPCADFFDSVNESQQRVTFEIVPRNDVRLWKQKLKFTVCVKNSFGNTETVKPIFSVESSLSDLRPPQTRTFQYPPLFPESGEFIYVGELEPGDTTHFNITRLDASPPGQHYLRIAGFKERIPPKPIGISAANVEISCPMGCQLARGTMVIIEYGIDHPSFSFTVLVSIFGFLQRHRIIAFLTPDEQRQKDRRQDTEHRNEARKK